MDEAKAAGCRNNTGSQLLFSHGQFKEDSKGGRAPREMFLYRIALSIFSLAVCLLFAGTKCEMNMPDRIKTECIKQEVRSIRSDTV